MPAVTPQDLLSLPRLNLPDPAELPRPVVAVVDAPKFLEGDGFQVRRAFAGIDLQYADPFLMLDHMGAVEYAPGEAKGASDHPHRGFETVTYMLDGKIKHRDSNGGGGVITDGATQWMTAGAGIVHSELPTEDLVMNGGLFHGVQLWVNLPKADKWNPPRYQDIASQRVALLSSNDGGAVVRVIAGAIDGHAGPGSTRTPITYAHVTLSPGARLQVPWRSDFNALTYVLAGHGAVGADPGSAPIAEGQLGVYGDGDWLEVRADERQDPHTPTLELLLLGGRPIREPIAWYGPFVMNTKAEIVEAIEDYQAGKMGSIPAEPSGA
jgi:redox-sensitive bicupin YhaK (pirin superfamily)